MGLDMYAYITNADIPDVDFKEPDDSFPIARWRKHPNLHGWMHDLYMRKGGSDSSFNGATLRLTPDDIDELEQAINAATLPETSGFFYGEIEPEEKARDLAFIQHARNAFSRFHRLFYYAWW
jgi:hypothetical protein